MSLRHQVERAFKAVVLAIPNFPADTVNVYTGSSADTQQVPCVVCWCKGGMEDPKGSGNRFMTVTVICKSRAVEADKGDGSDLDPVKNIDQLSRLVFNGLKVGNIDSGDDPDSLAAKLSKAVDGLTVFHPVIETGYDPDLAEFSFLDSITFQVYCCEAEIV